MSKKKEDKWLQVGNFLLGVEMNRNGAWFVVKTVGGEWSIRYGDGSMMFSVLANLGGDESCHRYLESLLTLMYAATSYPHDMVSIVERQTLPFINGFCKLLDEQTAFEVSVSKKATEQEDAEALKEVVEMREIEEELEKLDDELHEG